MTTTNLSDFGNRELILLIELLQARIGQGLPDDFDDDEVYPMMNQDSGNVFLTNSEYQVAMMNGDKLESFYWLGYAGTEGFIDELWQQFQDGDINENDYEELAYILENNNMGDEVEKVRKAIDEGRGKNEN